MKKQVTYCRVCEEEKEDGIYLYTLYICKDCEQDIIHTEPHEEKYQYYVQKLKNINQSQLYS